MDLMHKDSKYVIAIFRYSLMLPLLWLSQSVTAAPWDFETVVDMSVIYSDNLRLADAGSEEGEILYRLAPTFTAITEGDRLSAALGYRPEAIFFSDAPESNDIFNAVDANMTVALLRDAIFVYASAANYQSIASPDGQIPTSNIPITGNRIDSTILEIRPYWQQDIGFADVLLEFAYLDTRYDDKPTSPTSFAQDNNEWRGQFNLNNHSVGQGIAWGVKYQFSRLDYENALPWEYQQAALDLGYWINGTARVFVLGGVETPFDAYFDSAMDDEFWEVGFQYKPSQRLDLELAAGERSFGNTYRAKMVYQLRRGETALSYSEEPATRGDLGFDRRPIFATDNLDGFLDQPGASDRFIQKRGEWTTTIELSKSKLSLRLFSEERDQRTTDVGEALNSERYAGAAVRWAWNLGAKSTVGLSADLTQRDTSISEDELTRFAADYAYQISQRLSIVMLAQHSQQDNAESAIGRYTENQFWLTLRANL